MSEKRVRWGVLSTANIGRVAVLPAIRAAYNGELLAVGSRDKTSAEAFAKSVGIPQAYGSYEALLEDGNVDAVYIPLPNSLHKEWVLRAAKAGKHILCEKPLGLDAAECLEMQAAADANGVKLMEAFMYRFHPRSEKLFALVHAGALGKVSSINAAFTFRQLNFKDIRYQQNLGGGALYDVGCYCVNVMRTLAGAEPVEVSAFANWVETGVDQQLSGLLRFENGLLGHFDCGMGAEHREELTVAGEHAYFEVSNPFVPGTGEVTIHETRGNRERAVYSVQGADEYQRMVEHFGACILNNSPVRYGAGEAAANLRVISALYRSARSGGAPERVV